MILVIVIESRDSILGYIIQFTLTRVNLNLLSEQVPLVISSQRGDGSEMLVKDLPKELQSDFTTLVYGAKVFYGPSTRIYFTLRKEIAERASDSKNHDSIYHLHIEASPLWRDSFMFYNIGTTFHYYSNEDIIDSDILENKIKVNSNVLKE
ncbi:hypothetical protein GCM10023183_35100 [Nibribacter koreensis]|uniref:Uncharacterized protein n=1 Tax=Nibribacter koreensis TaxID=1084519 RepID=A0ABP8G0G9_9BACT